jgi:DNA-binding SARP family transcriptional activator
MQLKVLGSLELGDGDSVCTPKAPKTRKVLATLAMNANRTVSSALLVEEVWHDDPPPSAAATLQTYVFQIREALLGTPKCAGSRARAREFLSTQSAGYQLNLDENSLDLTMFQLQWREGCQLLAQRKFAAASQVLASGLALWRGSALADVQLGPVLEPHVRKLNEQRLAATECRLEAELALGHYQELIGDMVGLTCSYPLHEGLHAHLMRALYLAGRRSEALDVYRHIRTRLVRSTGLEPSRRLQAEQQRILREDDVPSWLGEPGWPALRSVPSEAAS